MRSEEIVSHISQQTVVTDSSRRTGPATTDPARSPLHVCHLAYTFYEADNRVIRYAETRAGHGDRVDVIALRSPGESRSSFSRGVRVSRIQRRTVTEKRAWVYLVKIFWFFIQSSVLLTFRQLRKRYDIVHVHNVPDFLVFAAFFPKLTGSRIILDIHDILPELYASKFNSSPTSAVFRSLVLVERLSCRFADHVIVANDLWHAKLVQRAVAAENCTTMLNYPDLRLFRPLEKKGKRTDGKFIILYPGTLNYHQGVDIAIKAFALVKERMPNAEFHIYGSGPTRSELLQLTNECGLNDRVRLMNPIPIEEIPKVMASADVGVVPKRAEGFGNEACSTKIMEFMACGVPVIVSRTRIDEYYYNDSLVRFFTSSNAGSLATALVEMYSHSHRLIQDRLQRASDFAFHNSWQKRGVEYERIIDSLMA